MSAQSRIHDLVLAKLNGRRIEVVGFIDELLEVASDVGEIHCRLASESRLRFEVPNQEAFEIELDACRGKLRMLCARLSVLCNETGSVVVSPYGGEGMIRKRAISSEPDQWFARFRNTPSDHEFTITVK